MVRARGPSLQLAENREPVDKLVGHAGGKPMAGAVLRDSRGGQTTKVHALTDVIGRPYALMLTPGNVADVKVAPELLARVSRVRYVLADKGYDADALRRSLRQAGAV